ncbi:recombinase family protein [Maricaulis salignorans]|uniref:Site-specific DNA recombinase n=1 Tax=Maricaulis salignorans TaxID=144026 RepID=A0A1G9UB89_9PROT|nr:recombinase family protein [Maricaulis salignorans]SDM56795.1 Site-specific DNA recombinase [Maricaulis salignorans]
MKVGYARVSTEDQSNEMQIAALKEAGCQMIFEESASGAQRDRPKLQEAMNYIRPSDTLVVWKMDRLARSLRQLIETVDQLGERDIGFISLTEDINTTTAGGRLVFHVFGALAEYEKALIGERTRCGLQNARAKGVRLGRPAVMTDDQIEMAKKVKAAGGHSMQAISDQLGVSRSTLYRVLAADCHREID